MKIALCLRGLSYGRNSARDPTTKGSVKFDIYQGFDYLNKTLLKKYDVDVFIHTWNHEREEDLIKLYQPKKMRIDRVTPEIAKMVLSSGGSQVAGCSTNTKCYAKYSNYYSLREVNRLRNEYQNEHQKEHKKIIKYDLVIQTRFDVQIEFKMDLNLLDLTKFYLFHKESRKFFIGKHSVYDYFFISNESSMDEFCQLWEKLPHVFEILKTIPKMKRVKTVYDINNHSLLGNYLYTISPQILPHLAFLQPEQVNALIIY